MPRPSQRSQARTPSSDIGLEADHRRALTEVKHRRRDAQFASGQLLVASANLIRLLVLDPKVVMVPVEPPECIIHLIPDDIPLDDLVLQGLQNRPELTTAQALVQAAAIRRQQAGCARSFRACS